MAEVPAARTSPPSEDPWRVDLLRRCGQLLLVGTPWAVYLFLRQPGLRAFLIYSSILLSGVATATATQANFRRRGSLLVLSFLSCGAVGVHFGGVSAGSVLCLALGPVIATVVLDWRAAAAAVGVGTLAISVLGSLGRPESTPRQLETLTRPEAWARMGVMFALLTALLVLVVSGSLRRVETSLVETRRALAEAMKERGAREAAEQRWRRISEASFEGVAFTEKGVLVDASEQFARMLGYPVEELVGKPVVELVAPEHRTLVQAIIGAGQTTTYSHHARRKDGSIFPVETRARMLTMGERALRVTVIRDLSEEERLQSELQKRERLAAVGEIVAGVAHEVRTPLFSISATLDAYEPHLEAARPRGEFAHLLRSQIDRLSALMRDLLDYGSPPALRLQRGTLEQPIRRALAACARLAQEQGVKLEETPGDVELDRDGERLEQVFVNLVSNAIHHAPRGSTVRVVARASQSPAGVCCSVEDEGAGVPAEDLVRVFQPFFSRRRGGTGLGLAIVQRIVEQHGGSVRAGNREGGGASFTVFLPAV